MKAHNEKPVENKHFKVDEVLEIKGFLFKIVLIDAFTGKIGLKQIFEQEAQRLKATQEGRGSKEK